MEHLTPEEIGREYTRAAEILRDTGEFGRKSSSSLVTLPHTFDFSRTQLHPNSWDFASKIVQLALQVDGEVGDDNFISHYLSI